MSDKAFLKLLSGYENVTEEGIPGKRFFCRKISGSATFVNKTRFSRVVFGGAARLGDRLAYSSTRAYGMFFLGFGLLSMLVTLARDYLGYYESLPISVLVVGAVFALIGIPFVLVDEPICLAFQRFVVTDYIFFEFFCLKRMSEDDEQKGIAPPLGLVLGILLALLGIVIPIGYVALGIAVAAYLFLSMTSPEFSLFFSFLAMPYLSLVRFSRELLLCFLVLVTLVSFAYKVLVGKRVFFFEQYDAVILLFNIPILLGGIFLKGVASFESSVLMLILCTGYVLTGSLITNRRLANCVVNAVVTSSVPLSVIAVVEFARGVGKAGFRGATATFSDPSELAAFLLLSAVCCLYFVLERHKRSHRIFYFVILVLTVVSLAFTMRVWAFVAAMLGVIVYGIVKLRRFSGAFVAAVSLLPYAIPFLGRNLLMRVAHLPAFKIFDLGQSVNLWEVGLSILRDHPFTGVGIGAQSFAEEYEKYAATGGVFNDCGNFLIQLGCEAGVFTVGILLILFAIRLRHNAVYQPYVKTALLGELSCFATSAISVLVIFGAFTYIFSDITMYYLFWCMFGIGSAALRVSKQEYDDRAGYFSDGSGSDAASVDILIKYK